ncbi:terminase large subunit domain-containing protein [Comamonas sp.]|uniref:terminase large subunit domain-containing protein n=1 Tax=Comamonas sp. TaxID=34028 RepID=UPI0028AF0303|nr:terminase family protein [Comamonas sp.]
MSSTSKSLRTPPAKPDLAGLTREQKAQLLELLQEKARREARRKLYDYAPYPRQIDFHNEGAHYRERLFRAGNQLGKTWSSAYEIAMHLTGDYPEWWEGRRWDRAVIGWALGESMESTRDTLQRLVLGRPGEWGTGTIPGDRIVGTPKRAQGIADAVDSVAVRHKSGGLSRLYFKSYEKGRSKLQGETLDFAALDEEPPLDIYTETLTRTNATGGIVWITFTPLKGMSEVVRLFLQSPTAARKDVNMTIDDVGHYTAEKKAEIIASYPEHEREARAKGIPTLGSGRIFPVADSLISVDPFPLPDLWPRIAGMDFGWDHPSAAAWLAWDRDENTLYVYDAMRVRESTPAEQAPIIKSKGDWIPMAWPHDGLQHEKGSGEQLAEQYRAQGVAMLHENAKFPEGHSPDGQGRVSRTSVEAGLIAMLDGFYANDPARYEQQRVNTGEDKPLRIKVFSNLADWFDEFRLYHRKDGKVVKLQDDLMAATRYAFMMLRYAITIPRKGAGQVMRRRRGSSWV